MNRVFLLHARLVDGTGATAVENGTLVFEKPGKAGATGKILYAGEAGGCSLVPGPGDETADLTGCTVMPGLFDAHVHLWTTKAKLPIKADPMGVPLRTMMYYRNALDDLMAGITTIRTCGGSDSIDIALRDCINSGRLPGARIYAGGSPIEPHGGHCHETWGTVECSGVDEFMKAARIQIREGVDFVKLMYTGGAGGNANESMYSQYFTDEEAAAVCKVVHLRGKRVAAHLSFDAAINSALKAGVDAVEHAYQMNEDTARRMVDQGVFYVPTMSVTGNASHMDLSTLQPRWRPVFERMIRAHEAHTKAFEYALKHGAVICSGTDGISASPTRGTSYAYNELKLMVEAGMNPLDAIKAATYNSACLCEMEKKVGSLKEGLLADLTVFDGKPDVNINDLDKLTLVAKEGQIVWSKVRGFEKSCCYAAEPEEGCLADTLGAQW